MILSILAITKDGLLGKDDFLPWDIREELKHFVKTTRNHTILMGRKTFEGIKQKKSLLTKRKVIVLTTKLYKPTFEHENLSVSTSLEDVLNKFKNSEEKLFICGGKSVYEQTFHFCDQIILSLITTKNVSGNIYIDMKKFEELLNKNFEVFRIISYDEFKVLKYRKIS